MAAERWVYLVVDGKAFRATRAEAVAFLQLGQKFKRVPSTGQLTAVEAAEAKGALQIRSFDDATWDQWCKVLQAGGMPATAAPAVAAPPAPAPAATTTTATTTIVTPARGTAWYLHGAQGTPVGDKATLLREAAREAGWDFDAPDFTDLSDADARVARLLARPREVARPLVLVGSSLGGYVAVVASGELRADGLLLLAPAVGLPGGAVPNPVPAPCPTVVIHGWDDDVIPPETSVAFARTHRATLHALPGGHRLAEQRPFVRRAFLQLLQDVTAPAAATAVPTA